VNALANYPFFMTRDQIDVSQGQDRNYIERTLMGVNGDGFVDREEYQQMVEDMAKLRSRVKKIGKHQKKHPFAAVAAVKESIQSVSKEIPKKTAVVASAARDTLMQDDTSVPVDDTEEEDDVEIEEDENDDMKEEEEGFLPIFYRLPAGMTVESPCDHPSTLTCCPMPFGIVDLLCHAVRDSSNLLIS
jgi:hypothetical protein